MNKDELLETLYRTGALQQGHFLLSSGLHSDRYVQCALLLQYPGISSRVGEELAELFSDLQVETVIGPAMGGIIIVYEVARHLKKRAIFTEREQGKMVLRRGFSLEPEEPVLVIEDVITTGGSVLEVIDVCHAFRAKVMGVGSIIDRSIKSLDLGVPLKSLLRLEIQTWKREECPLCQQGIKLVKPGSREIPLSF
ncbi:MAG: orotate phosphoribosyltransferase [Coprothermobacterota bacterium]|jgi:orotate phosphoribosyltransferase|nr:orotate phosphoribosyltransferase [Caldisericota bacterium]MDI6868620.1 orotate phosphoribosyltransferase [Coprothermobacterota bacterium]